jgi:DICT domain-containing protein
MGLADIHRELRGRERRLTLFDPPPGLAETFTDHFAARAVAVEVATPEAGPAGIAVVTEDREPLAVADVSTLAPPYESGETARVASRLSTVIADGAFVSQDPDQLMRTRREFEDRAWRSNAGALHVGVGAGLGASPVARSEASVLARLAESDLDVHVYAHADALADGEAVWEDDEPTPEGPAGAVAEGDVNVATGGVRVAGRLGEASLHTAQAAELRRFGVVAYDGGETPSDRCALVFEGRADRPTGGAWTYDDDVVDGLLAYLSRRYRTE